MSVQTTNETAEAVCSALHRLGWQFLGESDGGADTWFIRGTERGRQVRIQVHRHVLADRVQVGIEWHNLSRGEAAPVRCAQTLTIRTTARRDKIEASTQRAVLRCLEVFRDVVGGIGVASAHYLNSGGRWTVLPS